MLVNYLLQRDVNSFESLNAYVDMKITLKILLEYCYCCNRRKG